LRTSGAGEKGGPGKRSEERGKGRADDDRLGDDDDGGDAGVYECAALSLIDRIRESRGHSCAFGRDRIAFT
jgi:hypothetical protein